MTESSTDTQRKYKFVFVMYNLAHLDNWIKQLQPFLPNAQVFVFHIAELQGKKAPNVKGISFYDLSDMRYEQIRNILLEVNPSACVFLNFRSMFELLLQRISKDLHIPDYYLEHGIFNSNNLSFAGTRKKSEIGSSIKRQYCFLKKYVQFLFKAKLPFKEISVFRSAFLKGQLGKSPFTHYFVYGERCKHELSSLYNLNDANTTLVGYPLFRKNEEVANVRIHEKKNEVLYVHQPFIQDRYTSIGYEEERQYLIEMSQYLLSRYDQFTVLLHPREDLESYKERFKGTGINVIQRPGDYSVFSDKQLVIGHYSTALLFPLFFNTKTIIVDYPHAYIQPIFKGIFPWIHNLNKLTDIDNITVEAKMKDYLLGPAHSYEYIAQQLLSIVSHELR